MCIKFKPEHGRLQLWWSREFQAAHQVELQSHGLQSTMGQTELKMNHSDLKIDKWCGAKEGFLEYNTLDPPGNRIHGVC